MRKIIAVADSDRDYASSLAAWLNRKDLGGLKAVAWSDISSFRKERKNYDIRIMLASEEFCVQFSSEERPPLVIALCETESMDEAAASSSDSAVGKYIRTDELLRRILEIYSSEETDRLLRLPGTRSHITAVYSPVGRCGKTAFAVSLAMMRAAEGRVLFISLDEYQGIFRHIAAEAEKDLSDVIYMYKQEILNWSRLRSCIYPFGKIDYIPPVRYSEDLIQMNGEQITDLIVMIASEGGYSHIVVDTGNAGRRSMELFGLCDSLYMPMTQGDLAADRAAEFFEAMNRAGHDDTASEFVKISLPVTEMSLADSVRPESYMRGPMYDAALSIAGSGQNNNDTAPIDTAAERADRTERTDRIERADRIERTERGRRITDEDRIGQIETAQETRVDDSGDAPDADGSPEVRRDDGIPSYEELFGEDEDLFQARLNDEEERARKYEKTYEEIDAFFESSDDSENEREKDEGTFLFLPKLRSNTYGR